MIINFHPKEIESKKGPEIITKPNKDNSHTPTEFVDPYREALK
jgi:hypothetical protein